MEHDLTFPAAELLELSVDKRGFIHERVVFWAKSLLAAAIGGPGDIGIMRPVWLVVRIRESGRIVYRSRPIKLLEELNSAEEKLRDDLDHLTVSGFYERYAKGT